MKSPNPKIAVVIEDYTTGRYTNKELAARHGVSLSTILNWVRQSGVPRKGSGRPPQEQPSPRHLQMIELSAQLRDYEIARRFDVSRQRVHQVLTRWKHLLPPRPKPTRTTAVPMPKKPREIRGEIVSFRLTTKQTEHVRAALMTWGFGNRLSDSAACRAVLLAAVGLTRFELPAGETGFGAQSRNGPENSVPALASKETADESCGVGLINP
jgi:transposase-like protein